MTSAAKMPLVFFLLVFVAAAAIRSIRVPVKISGVAFEDGAERHYTNETNEYGISFLQDKFLSSKEDQGSAGNQSSTSPAPSSSMTVLTPDEVEWEKKNLENGPLLDVRKYALRLVLILVIESTCCLISYFFRTNPDRLVWIAPFFVYVALAVWRLLYVPCIWIVREKYRFLPAQYETETRAIWEIGATKVRYGLVFFEEFSFLMLLGIFYWCAFLISSQLKLVRKPEGSSEAGNLNM